MSYTDLPEGAVVETAPQPPPAAAPQQAAPQAAPAFADLPAGAVVEHPSIDPDDPWAGVVGEDGQPLGPEGGYGMDPETGEWHLYGRVTDDTPMERPDVGRGEAWWRGVRSGALRGWDDELAAGSGAVGNWLGTQLGLNESTAEFGDIYERLLANERMRSETAFEDHPIAYGAGFVPGMFTGPTFAAGARLPQAPTHASRIGRAMKIGAGEGAVAGAGNADDSENFLERLDDAAVHGAIGGALGPVADYAVSGVTNVGGRMARAVTRHRSPDSGLETLIQRNEVGPPGEMAARADEMRAGGVEPRLVDVITDEGRTTVREAASKNTPARREVAEAAESTYAAVPDRVAQQARKISAEPRTARQIATAVEEEQRLMGPTFDAVRGNPVEITPEIAEVLGKAQGRAALRQAAKWLPPAEEKQVMGLIRAMNDVNKIDPRMPPAVRSQIAAQILADQKLTVDVVDKWSRAISKAGDASGMYALAKDMVDVVKGQARAQYPEYDAALNQFAARARVGEAASGTGRFDESSFTRTPPDSYEAAVRGASREPAALLEGGGRPTTARLQRTYESVMDDGTTAVVYNYRPESGDEIPMYVFIKPNGSAVVDVSRGAGDPTLPNRLGAAEVRSIMADIQEAYPQITQFNGHRISGARAARPNIEEGRIEEASNLLNDVARHAEGAFTDYDVSDAARYAFSPEELSAALANVPADKRWRVADQLAEWGIEVVAKPRVDTLQRVPAMTPQQVRRITPQPQPTVSEADALAARARDEVVDAAQAGQGKGALNVAAQVGRGPAQQQRNRALLGEEGAAGLEQGMRAEVDRVRNMQAIDPRSGQQPRMRGNDAMVDGFASAISSSMAPGGATFWTGVRTAARWLANGGIHNVDAERLARDAISDDPARVNAAIDFLERRGLQRSRAQRFVSTLGAALAGRATSPDTADTEYKPPVSSARALMKETQ